MIPMIQQAVTMGYTAVQILKYISTKFKSAAPGIANARQQGYSDEDILKFIGGKIKPKNQKKVDGQLSAQERYMKASGLKTKEEREDTRNKFISGALGVGATALGAYNMYKNYGGIMNSLTSVLGQAGNNPQTNVIPQNPSPPTTPTNPPIPGAPINPPAGMPQSPGQMATPQTPMPGPQIGQQIAQGVQQPIEDAMQPTTQSEMGQAAQAIPQPQQPGQQLPSIFEELTKNVDVQSLSPEKVKQLQFVKTISDKLEQEGKPITDPAFQGVAKKINSILQGKPGTVIEETARVAGTQIQKHPATVENVKKYADIWKQSKEKDPNFPHSLEKILQTNLDIDKESAKKMAKAFGGESEVSKQPIAPKEPEITSVDAAPIAKPLSKGSEVITPTGDIARIDDLPGKTAKVDVDGTKQVHATDDLIPIPDNSKEIGDLYQELIDTIPEGNKSRVYDAIGYDPQRNAIKYTYHDGKSYIIDDVPEEIAKEIANSGYLAKTSGGNYMGFYYKGNPSIGAGMSVLINDLQKLRGGKGKEYSYKFEELYSQHRLPKNILKERSEQGKLRAREEKAKKKRSTP